MKKLGIIAGNGTLPSCLIQECARQHRPFFVLALTGHADPKKIPAGMPVSWVRLGEVGKGFRELRAAGAREVVLIGGVRRPSLAELMPDWRGLRLFARAGLGALGDDGLLRAVVKEIEREGFSVVGIDSLLPQVLAPEGVLSRRRPDKTALADIQKGLRVARLLGQADVGQAVVMQQGLVVAVEALEGTQKLIQRVGPLLRAGAKGVLVKAKKPQQDTRVDLPAIGPDTLKEAAKAGLRGVAVEAGGTLIAQLDACRKTADKLGLFLAGVKGEKC